MAIVPYEFIYRNSLQALGDFHSQFFADATGDGDIVAVYFKAQGVTDFTDDWYFGLKVNGADVLTGGDRPHITALDLEPFIDGLSIPVLFLDRFSPTIDERATGMINGPITVIIMVDDGIATGDIGDAIHAATTKATPVDADEIGFWDSVSMLLRKATFLNAWNNYFKGKADALYATPSIVNDTAYDATTWNGDTSHAPSKNAVRDKIEAMGSASVSDVAYDATSWDGVTTVAPSKNAVRDEFELVIASISASSANGSVGFDDGDSLTSDGSFNFDSGLSA